jgi:hypothetical protein
MRAKRDDRGALLPSRQVRVRLLAEGSASASSRTPIVQAHGIVTRFYSLFGLWHTAQVLR